MNKESLKIVVVTIIVAMGLFVLAYQFVDPPPPKELTLCTGSEEGAYFAYGKRFREILARDGITVHVKSTSGSLENLRELLSGSTELAFVQTGTAPDEPSDELYSLASLFYEPLWVFCRKELSHVTRLTELAGKRLAIGGEGSGTRALSLQVLGANGLSEKNAVILEASGDEAADALLGGQIDVAFFVASPKAPVINRLMSRDDIGLMDFVRADAYAPLFRHLSSLRLPRGVINLEDDIPSRDRSLIAATATLVAGREFHPALTELFLKASQEIFVQGGLLETPDMFPSRRFVEYPLSDEARRFFVHGPSFLQRVLPFGVASLIERLKIMILPLIALLIPLVKIIAPTYRWKVRSRIYRWYRDLSGVEIELSGDGDKNHAIAELNKIDDEVSKIQVPLSYSDELYNLRLHIDLVRKRWKLEDVEPGSTSTANSS